MRDEDWVLLKTLFECKSLSRASQKLFLTQPALSRQLAKIEREFNVVVATRTTGGLVFTPDGEYLARQADKFLDILKETHKYLAPNPGNTLLIGSSTTFARFTLLRLIREFNELDGSVTVFVTATPSDSVLKMVQEKKVHLGFIRGEYRHDLREHVVSQAQGLVVSHRPISLNDLPEMPLILHSRDEYTIHFITQWWAAHFETPLVIRFQVGNVETSSEMIRSGMGWGIFFSDYLEEQFFYRIPMLTRDGEPMMRKTLMLFSNESYSMSGVRAFVDFIQRQRL